jgi:hypothetical protein
MLSTKIRTTAVVLAALFALTATSAASAARRVPQGHSHQPVHGQSISHIVKRGAGPVVKPVSGVTYAAISAFPTGGKGSGTEATCALWSGRLNEEQGEIDAAEENNDLGKYQEAKGSQDEDIDNALDAGCAVIY